MPSDNKKSSLSDREDGAMVNNNSGGTHVAANTCGTTVRGGCGASPAVGTAEGSVGDSAMEIDDEPSIKSDVVS